MSNAGAGISARRSIRRGPARPDDAPMTFAAATTRRLILVPSGPRAERGDEMVRRFRLARLRLEGRPVSHEQRFDHVKRSYD